ncbi:TonB family protein [candidate division WOR-3 bacterium]|uniref:TonB family protein n=1 Tax=candidate division WOR-3 bacterium TaxID=2052148 RepID=A0A9D5QCA3_UNCW3|nr:TonB family protein [candidate division WOR-3 bacterium]MBD3364334.1 TonB family protein [candidate division WOR-3 bacterium]
MQDRILGVACMLPETRVMLTLPPADTFKHRLEKNEFACFFVTSRDDLVSIFGDTLSLTKISSVYEEFYNISEQSLEFSKNRGIALTGDEVEMSRIAEIKDSLGYRYLYMFLFPGEKFEDYRNMGLDVLNPVVKPATEPEDSVSITEGMESEEVLEIPYFRLEVKPVPVNQVDPEYPDSSRVLDHQGTVYIEVVLDTDGYVLEATVVKSSGYSELDDAALKAARMWTFTPARYKGQPVRTHVNIPFVFTLAN